MWWATFLQHVFYRTEAGRNLLIDRRVICNEKKSMFVSADRIQAEGLGSFCKNLGRPFAKVGKIFVAEVMKSPGSAQEFGALIGTAAVSKNPKASITTIPEVISCNIQEKGFVLENLHTNKHNYKCIAYKRKSATKLDLSASLELKTNFEERLAEKKIRIICIRNCKRNPKELTT